MIENRLSYQEISKLLDPILALHDLQDSIMTIGNVFNITIDNISELHNYLNKHNVIFEGFRLSIRDISMNSNNNLHIHLQLRAEYRWWFAFLRPEKKVISALQKICAKQYQSLMFSKYKKTVNSYAHGKIYLESQSFIHTFYYDSQAFNRSATEEGITLSPLIIGTSRNEKYQFVEFSFCASCYEMKNSKITLKSSWVDYMCN